MVAFKGKSNCKRTKKENTFNKLFNKRLNHDYKTNHVFKFQKFSKNRQEYFPSSLHQGLQSNGYINSIMKSIKIILILKFLLLDVMALDEMQFTTEQIQLFNDFKDNFHKIYSLSEAESKAMKSFIENVALINAHNLQYDNGETIFRLGISDLSDLSTQELNDQLNGFQPMKFPMRTKTTTQDTTIELLTCEQTNQNIDNEPSVNERVNPDLSIKSQQLIPESIDWRFALQPIRFQGKMLSKAKL